MKRTIVNLAVAALISATVYADETSMSVPLTAEQAQARQVGIFLGGTASQYDLCVRKGFLAKGDRSSEEIAKSILEKMRTLDKGADQSAFAQEGWDMIKKEISEHESFFTQEKCASVGKEWAKLMTTLKK
jgi:hypothetical protein